MSSPAPLPDGSPASAGPHGHDPAGRPDPAGSEKWSAAELSLLIGSVALITLSAFEALATTTIMPAVVHELHAESWFSLASGAALAAQLPATVLAGALSDSRGAKPVLLTGMALFAAGLVMCALAPHVVVFVAGRLVQGLGGGLVIVPLYVMVGSVSTDRHRASFFAAFSLAWVLPSLIGPAIAGLVTSHWGWRPIFGAVPVLAVLAALPLLLRLRDMDLGGGGTAGRITRLALLALAAGVGVVSLQLAGALGGPAMWVLALVGVLLSAWALPRLLPAGTFRLRTGIPTVIATRFLAMGALMGATAFVPLVLQRVHGWGVDQASLAVTLGSVSWAVGASLQARVVEPRARRRLPLVGTVLLTLGMLPVAALAWEAMPVGIALGGWTLAGLGIGFVHSTLSDLTLGMVERPQHGRASSWLQVADNAGAALELAAVSLALAVWGRTWGTEYLPASLIALTMAALSVLAAWRITRSPA